MNIIFFTTNYGLSLILIVLLVLAVLYVGCHPSKSIKIHPNPNKSARRLLDDADIAQSLVSSQGAAQLLDEALN